MRASQRAYGRMTYVSIFPAPGGVCGKQSSQHNPACRWHDDHDWPRPVAGNVLEILQGNRDGNWRGTKVPGHEQHFPRAAFVLDPERIVLARPGRKQGCAKTNERKQYCSQNCFERSKIENKQIAFKSLIIMVGRVGIEPTTKGL